ncbi:hypothetical protein [Prosthecobacter sp.]|uniref:hypothetical protein n=1 Tax=Prosthecobacter sp. TaxID=1965333 RepID=UPI0037840715
MSNSAPNRKFQFGHGWLLFFGMVALLVFSKNSRVVVKTMMERVKEQATRMNTEYEGLKSTLAKKKQEDQ